MSDALVDRLVPTLEGRIATTSRKHHLPGVAAGIVRGDRLVWSHGFGFADVEEGRAPDDRTLFRVASISKTVTATAVLQLRDAGLLALDEPLARFIPEFASVRARAGRVEDATIRRLLSHQSGLITEGPFSYWDSMEFPPIAAILGELPETEIVIEPGLASKYSNLAYALLGELVARLSGRPFEAYVREEIFRPLGMEASSFAPEEIEPARLATGYDPHPFEDMPQPARHTPARGVAAAAGLYTCVQDLARWIALQFQADGGERQGAQVVRGATIAEMQRPQEIDATWTFARCLGWGAQRRGERIYHGHGGSIHGFITQILFSVPRRAGVIILTNEGRHSAAGTIALETLDVLVDAIEAEPEGGAWESPRATPAAWQPLLGRYEYWRGGLLHVETREGRLRLVLPPGVESALHAPSALEPTEQAYVFRVAEGRGAGELLTFQTEPDGDVAGFTLAGFQYRKLGAMFTE